MGYAPRKRTVWAVLTAVVVPIGAVLGLVANLGGTRDAVCSIGAMSQSCLRWGLIVADAPVEPIEAQRGRLLQSVAGTWSRLDRNCVETIAYSIERDEFGTHRIRGAAPDFESVMQVMTIDPANGAIAARASAPQ